METNLEKSGLDYTIVRPPGLTDKPASGKVIIEPDRSVCKNVKWTITRSDLASILIDVAVNQQYKCKAIAVANI